MKTITSEIKESIGYVIPISDLHLGDKSFTENSMRVLKGNLDWVKERPNARIVLVGDIFNCATRLSKTEPFNENIPTRHKGKVNGVIDWAEEIFAPYKDKIVTAVDGNHEHRIEDFANFSVMNEFCRRLNIPYSNISCAVCFRINKRGGKDKNSRFRQNYIGYFHHTTGGGRLMGTKLNRVEIMTTLLANADFYVGAHHHGLLASPIISREYNLRTGEVEDHRQVLIGAGGYLEWDESYGERGMLRPLKIGSPRIRLDGVGDHKDIHVSL